jgi:hypothetical protein
MCSSSWSVSSIGTSVIRETTSKLAKISASCRWITLSFWISASEFLIWWDECPINGLSRPVRYLVSKYVTDAIQFTIGLSGMSFLWIFGSPYSLGGTEMCGISFFAAACGISDFFYQGAR